MLQVVLEPFDSTMASRTRISAAAWQQREGEDNQKPLKLSKFDGRNASAWVSNANQFVSFEQTLLYMRVHIASFYMKGEALIWFKKAQRSDFETWEEFVEALQARFSEEWQHQREIEIQKILGMAERLKVLLDNFE
jgi:hypothetical protein